MTLRELQQQFFRAISSPLPEDEQLLDSREAAALDNIAAELILPNSRLTAGDRLGIYRRQYWYRLIDSLYEDFPGLRAVVGDDLFYKIALTYIDRKRSRHPNLRDLGNRLTEFVSEYEDIPEELRHGAVEMTQLEWASIEAFDGRALPVITPEAVPAAPRLQPYISLLKLNYPWDEFLCEVKRGESVRTEAASAKRREHESLKKISGLPTPELIYLVVHRFNSRVFYKRVTAAQFKVLSCLKSGTTLDQALASVLELLTPSELEDIQSSVASWFNEWRSLGWLTAESIPPAESGSESRD